MSIPVFVMDDSPSEDGQSQTQGRTLSSRLTCVIIVVPIVVVGTALIAFLTACLYRRRRNRQYQQAADSEAQSQLWMKDGEKRLPYPYGGAEASVEIQRQEMIHKSLAARSTSGVLHVRRPSETSEDDSDEEVFSERDRSLMTEWKEWEANMQRERCISLESHPGLDRNVSGASTVTVPRASRSGSPARNPFLVRTSTPQLKLHIPLGGRYV